MVLLDPVGAGASKLRTETALKLMQEIHFDVIRGNVSEIKTLVNGTGTTKGVDADAADAVTEENLLQMMTYVKAFAKQTGSIIAVTGAIDLVADAETWMHTLPVYRPNQSGRSSMRNGLVSGQQCLVQSRQCSFRWITLQTSYI